MKLSFFLLYLSYQAIDNHGVSVKEDAFAREEMYKAFCGFV